MYPAQCTSCAVEQSFEWTPGEPCFDCGGACNGAMICPDCLETRNAENLAMLIKTNPKACPTCSSPYPQPQEWRKSSLEDLLPLIDHSHYGDWVLLALCQWLKAYMSADKGAPTLSRICAAVLPNYLPS